MKYNIIYADPPWAYRVWSKKGEGRSAEHHYPTLTLDDIANLPVTNIAAEDCALFLWVTMPCLEQSFYLLHRWGFTYKTVAFNWCKQNKKTPSWFWGLGHWTRANSELCLLATRGSPKRVGKGVHQIIDDNDDFFPIEDIITPVERHSKKPDVVRQRIVELCGDLPRIELFARERAEGWNALGNELDGKDIRQTLQEEIAR